MTAYEFYLAFLRRLMPPQALSNQYLTYFYDRGISNAMIAEAGIRFLTPNPDAEENKAFKACMHESRINATSGAPDPIVAGILFPYFADEPFGVTRILACTDTFREYYENRHESVPKMLSPKARLVNSASHLYILPSEAAKIRKQTTAIHLIEGQAKSLKLIQDMRAANMAADNAVIGLQGVDMLLPCPETQSIQWRNRYVFLWFDADSKRKPSVSSAEIKIAAFLLAKGARVVKSCAWPEERGNGYDDHSVYAAARGFPPEINLKLLLSKAKETFRKYAPEEGDALPLETFCRAIAKIPNLQRSDKSLLISKLEKVFKPLGWKSADIKDAFESEVDYEQQEKQAELLKQNAEYVQQFFDIEYTPDMPNDYFLKGGHLCYLDAPLCRPFIIKKFIASDDADKTSYLVARFQHGEMLISTDAYTNFRSVAQIFNRRQEILCDESARHVQRYISHYWIRNNQHIPVVPLFENTGWDKAGEFRLPTLDAESVYAPHIKDAFQTAGDADEQRKFLRDIMAEQPAALIALLGYVTPLIGLFNLKPAVVMIYGGAGDGKSTAAFLPLSLYGHYQKLYQTMNATKVGKEISFAMSKDLPCLFDEMNTAGNGDGMLLAKTLIETIYGYYSGKGRTRSTVNLALAHQAEYQGLLMLTSERSLESIFSVMPNMSVAGAYRRTLEIAVLDRHALWRYEDSDSAAFFSRIYTQIGEHYGHAGKEWLEYLSDPAKQDDIKRRYERILSEKTEGRDLKGTENLIALIEAILPDVETVLLLRPGVIERNISGLFADVLDQQNRQIARQIQNINEKFVDALNAFIALNVTAFDGVCPAELAMTKIYGAVKDADDARHVFLRPMGLATLCNDYGFDRNGLLSRLKDAGIFLPELRNRVGEQGELLRDERGEMIVEEVDYKSMRIRNTGGNAYHFVIPAALVEWNALIAAPEKTPPEKIF